MYEQDFDWGHTDTGLPDEFVATMTNCRFWVDPESEYEALTLTTELVDPADPGANPWTLNLTVGNGWEAIDGGAAVVRTDGKAKNFHQSTGLGLSIDFLQEHQVDINALVKKRQQIPTMAGFWNGMTFFFKQKNVDYKGEIGKRDKLLPAYVVDDGTGVGSGGAVAGENVPAATPVQQAPVAAPVTSPVAKAVAAAPVAAAPASPFGGTPTKAVASAPVAAAVNADPYAAIKQQIYAIAMTSDTPDNFQMACIQNIPQATTDPAVTALIENLDGEGSIWAQAVADYNAQNPPPA